ncbi:hypothetical protein [Burkholderia latens]|uniref:hypothetical protein n=1 Tax=Burkholderia latens TaxID=488446 RepID=UPI0015898EE3|nr:hypothetical protein [Burkholderia latens]
MTSVIDALPKHVDGRACPTRDGASGPEPPHARQARGLFHSSPAALSFAGPHGTASSDPPRASRHFAAHRLISLLHDFRGNAARVVRVQSRNAACVRQYFFSFILISICNHRSDCPALKTRCVRIRKNDALALKNPEQNSDG